jgi:hypothetical protein
VTRALPLAAAVLAAALAAVPASGADPGPAAPLPGSGVPLPPRAEAEAWTVALELPAPLPTGAPATARIRLVARAGHHVNLEYPAAFRPDGRSTVTFAGPRVALGGGERRRCDGRPAETCEVAWELPFTPGAEAIRISGTALFSVCTADRCLIERVGLAAEARR